MRAGLITVGVLLTALPLCAFAQGESVPGARDLDIGALAHEGEKVGKEEGETWKKVEKLKAAGKGKAASDKELAKWKPTIDSFNSRCGVETRLSPAAHSECEQERARLLPEYQPALKRMQDANAELAALGVDRPESPDWGPRWDVLFKEAVAEHEHAQEKVRQWAAKVRIARLSGSLQECLQTIDVKDKTPEEIAHGFRRCWDGEGRAPSLDPAAVNRGTNFFSNPPSRPSDQTGEQYRRALNRKQIEVPAPAQPVKPCSWMEWLLENQSSGRCHQLTRPRRPGDAAAVRG